MFFRGFKNHVGIHIKFHERFMEYFWFSKVTRGRAAFGGWRKICTFRFFPIFFDFPIFCYANRFILCPRWCIQVFIVIVQRGPKLRGGDKQTHRQTHRHGNLFYRWLCHSQKMNFDTKYTNFAFYLNCWVFVSTFEKRPIHYLNENPIFQTM